MHPGWELSGKHVGAACFYCHEGTPPVFEGTTKLCFGCHEPERKKVTQPDHTHFPSTCEDCHTTAAWKPAKPDHAAHEPLPAPLDAGAPPTDAGPATTTPTARPTTAPTHRPPPRPTSTPTSTSTSTLTLTPTALPPDIPVNASRRR